VFRATEGMGTGCRRMKLNIPLCLAFRAREGDLCCCRVGCIVAMMGCVVATVGCVVSVSFFEWGLVVGESDNVYPLSRVSSEGGGARLVLLLRWVVLLLCQTRWMFGVTRRVLPLLAASKMVFDMTKGGGDPPRHVVVSAKVAE